MFVIKTGIHLTQVKFRQFVLSTTSRVFSLVLIQSSNEANTIMHSSNRTLGINTGQF